MLCYTSPQLIVILLLGKGEPLAYLNTVTVLSSSFYLKLHGRAFFIIIQLNHKLLFSLLAHLPLNNSHLLNCKY
jgi:hypothetical protein